MVPKPKPGREYLREIYSRTTGELGNITANVIKSLRDPSRQDESFEKTAQQLRAIALKLRATSIRLALAKLEPSLIVQWAPERYAALQKRERCQRRLFYDYAVADALSCL